MRVTQLLTGVIVAVPLCFSSALAGALEDGVAAHERQDYATALRLFLPLADQGDVAAEFNLGSMYAYGEGVPRDFAEAGKWFRKAANGGHAAAQFNLGAMYAEGQGRQTFQVAETAFGGARPDAGAVSREMELQARRLGQLFPRSRIADLLVEGDADVY